MTLEFERVKKFQLGIVLILMAIGLSLYIRFNFALESMKFLSFFFFYFVLSGLYVSISTTESVKNDLSDGVIKTYISYPQLNGYSYFISKLMVKVLFAIPFLIFGLCFAWIVLSYPSSFDTHLLFLSIFFIIVYNVALGCIVILLSRFGIFSELFSILFFLGIFYIILTSVSTIEVSYLFPLLLLGDKGFGTVLNWIFFTAICVSASISFLLTYLIGWRVFYKFL
ncbi:hypothetical protein Thermo_01294 [Thermoplasmatales archaeon]|nr:hypothetical protein Thermo_01294 [Thermoplasmatales archaeon]